MIIIVFAVLTLSFSFSGTPHSKTAENLNPADIIDQIFIKMNDASYGGLFLKRPNQFTFFITLSIAEVK